MLVIDGFWGRLFENIQDRLDTKNLIVRGSCSIRRIVVLKHDISPGF